MVSLQSGYPAEVITADIIDPADKTVPFPATWLQLTDLRISPISPPSMLSDYSDPTLPDSESESATLHQRRRALTSYSGSGPLLQPPGSAPIYVLDTGTSQVR